MARGKYQEWLEPDNLLRLQAWARDGLTDEQIAHNMGIAYSTLRVWKEKYSAISAALKKGKEVVDIQVENALLKRALGYSYNEVVRERVRDDDTGDYKLEITKTIKKEVVPDTTAQIFWLKNRKPIEWRDRKETEISGGLNVNNPFAELTTEELRKLARSGK
jgi:hypothetical protein